jgi:hypothetical protein
VNSLLALLSSEISNFSEWNSTLGTKKSPEGPNLESRAVGGRQSSRAGQLGDDSHLVLRQKFTDEE